VKTRLAILALICPLVAAPAYARDSITKGDVGVVPLHGEVAPSLLAFLRRAVKTAESNEASAIIFDMNTYGGRLDTATDIVNALNQTKIPTYTFINTNAGSAGALIAIATQHIYMAPVSAIGAAAPILPTGEDLPATAKEKTISYWSALIRGSATNNGHNPDVAEAFINKDKEVKIGDRVVHPKGAVLTLNAQEATERISGKPLLAEGVADSVSDLIKKAGLKGNEVTIEPTGFEQIAFWITALAPLLLLGGILGAYLEFKIPGVTWPGVISAICFTLFFLGHYLAGLAGWEVVALFILGMVLVLIEILFFAHFRCRRRFPHARFAAVDDGRSLSGPEFLPNRQNARDSAAQHVHRDCGLIYRNRFACALPSTHKHLSPVRFDGFKSAWAIARWRAATVRNSARFGAGNARHRRYGFTTKRQSAFR
jgi:membrane-bound ClpP family serine protease